MCNLPASEGMQAEVGVTCSAQPPTIEHHHLEHLQHPLSLHTAAHRAYWLECVLMLLWNVWHILTISVILVISNSKIPNIHLRLESICYLTSIFQILTPLFHFAFHNNVDLRKKAILEIYLFNCFYHFYYKFIMVMEKGKGPFGCCNFAQQ